jgi:arylsulfatase A-like enzyme
MAKKGFKPGGTAANRPFVSTGIDIMPTILDFAGIPIPESLQGISLKPVLTGGRMPKRDYVVTETAFAQAENHAGYYGRMIRVPDFKYIVYNKGKIREELFDMKKDPGETRNLALDEKYREILHSLRARLAEWGKKTNDDFPYIV